MNRIYKVVFCKAKQAWVVTSELSKSNGKTKSRSNKRSSKTGGFSLALKTVSTAVLLSMGSQQALAADAVCVDPNNTKTTVGTTTGAAEQVACGQGAKASGARSTAVGSNATAFTGESTALGLRATAQGAQSTALGNDSLAYGYASMSNGGNRSANNNVGLKYSEPTTDGKTNPSAPSGGNVAGNLRGLFGTADYAGSQYFRRNVAAGKNSQAWGTHAQALGDGSVAMGLTATAGDGTGEFGKSRTDGLTSFKSTSGEHSIAIGSLSWAKSDNSIAMGLESLAADNDAIAIGTKAEATAADAFALGESSQASGANSLALGAESQAKTQSAVAIGRATFAQGTGSTAIGGGAGSAAKADGAGAVAIGGGYTGNTAAKATASRATAIGNGADASLTDSVALGSKSVADRTAIDEAKVSSSSTPTGDQVFVSSSASAADKLAVTNTVKGTLAAVSVGSSTNTRQIINVAAGRDDTDAVNVAQLKAVSAAANSKTYFHNNSTGDDKAADPTASTDNLAGVNGIGGATGGYSLAAGVSAQATGTNAIAIGKEVKSDNLNTIVIGYNINQNKTTSGRDSVAIGSNVESSGQYSFALGTNAQAKGFRSIAIGGGNDSNQSAVAIGRNTIAFGQNTDAEADFSFAIGSDVKVSGSRGVGIGRVARVHDDSGVAIGRRAEAGSTIKNATDAVAIGRSARALSGESVAIGFGALAHDEKSFGSKVDTRQSVVIGRDANIASRFGTSLGYQSTIRQNSQNAITIGRQTEVGFASDAKDRGNSGGAIAIGDRTKVYNRSGNAIAMGTRATVYNNSGEAIAIGNSVDVKSTRAIAIGSDANVEESSNHSIAIGRQADVASSDSVAIGFDANVAKSSTKGIAIGRQANVSGGESGIAMGDNAIASAASALAIGDGAQAKGKQSISIGTGNIVSGDNSGAFGDPTIINGKNSYSVGNNNKIDAAITTGAFVLGNSVDANVDNSVYLGNDSQATAGSAIGTAVLNSSGVAGATTTAGDTGTVSNAKVGDTTYSGFAGATASGVITVGAAGSERRIQNVAAGEVSETSTDAINGSQLFSVAKTLDRSVYFHVNDTGKAATVVATNKGVSDATAGASGINALAAGVNATATGTRSSAVGNASKAAGSQASAFGDDAQANADNTLAMGSISRANGKGSTAVGSGATTRVGSGAAVAVGSNSSAASEDVAIGGGALSKGTQDAQGFETDSGGQNTAVGYFSGSKLSGTGNTLIGRQAGANTTGDRNALVGHNAGGGGYGVAFAISGNDNVGSGSGVLAAANGNNNIGFGAVAGAQVTGSNNVAIGFQAGTKASFDNKTGAPSAGAAQTYSNTVNIGNKTQALTNNSIAIGNTAEAGVGNAAHISAIAIGDAAKARNKATVAIGNKAQTGVGFNDAIAIGTQANANSSAGIAIGFLSETKGTKATAVGQGAKANGTQSTSIGTGANASLADSVALGSGSVADRAAGLDGYNPVTGAVDTKDAGIVATKSTLAAVSIGSAGNTRQIINVAAGTNDSDAVNVAQLKALREGVVGYTAGVGGFGLKAQDGNEVTKALGNTIEIMGGGSTAGTYTTNNVKTVVNGDKIEIQIAESPKFGNVTINDGNTGKITGVTAGTDDKDAVNVSQLNTLGDSVASSLGGTSTYDNKTGKVTAGLAVGGTTYTTVQDALNQVNAKASANNTTTAGKNIVVTTSKNSDGSTNYKVQTSDEVTFTKTTVGTVVTDATTNKISGLAVGDINATSTDAVNGSQIHNIADQNATNVFGGNASVNADGSTSFTNIGDTGKDTIHDAISAINTKAGQRNTTSAGTNIEVVETKNANGTTNYEVKTKSDVAFDNVNINKGIVVSGGATVNMGDNVVTNVSAGKNDTDAVNVSQLNAATKGWNIGDDPAQTAAPVGNVKSGERVDFVSGDTSNTVVTVTDDAVNGNSKVEVKVADNPTFQGNVTAKGANTVVVNSTTGTVNGLTNKTFDANNYVSGQAATEDQLAAVSQSVGANNEAIDNNTRNIRNNAKKIARGLNVAGNSGKFNRQLGDTVTIKGGLAEEAPASNRNVRTTANGGVVEILISENPNFQGVEVEQSLKVNNGATVDMGGNRIQNVAAGTQPNDAVNFAQLSESYRYVDQVGEEASAGIAAAIAAANLPQPFDPGANMMSLGLGSHHGQQAIAIGVSTISDNGKWIIKGSLSHDTKKNVSGGVGVGFQW